MAADPNPHIEAATAWFVLARAMALADRRLKKEEESVAADYAMIRLGLDEDACAEAKERERLSMGTADALDTLRRGFEGRDGTMIRPAEIDIGI